MSGPYDLAWPLSWVDWRSPQCEHRSDSLPASTNRKLHDTVLVHRDQRPPEIVRRAPIKQFDSTKGHSICSQLVPAQIDPANIRPACHHSTGAHPHSLVHHLANRRVPTTSASLNRCARHYHQVARVQQWALFVTLLMEMEMDSHGGLEVTIRQTESKKNYPTTS